MLEMILGNAHYFEPKETDYIIYIGRGSHKLAHYNSGLGNPFTVEEFGRDKAIQLYSTYLEDSMLEPVVQHIKSIPEEYKRVVLLCYCYPNLCHGSIIKNRLIDLLYSSNYTLHSGGAYGADTFFGEMCTKYNVEQKHYYLGERNEYNAPNGNIHITPEDEEEGKYKVAKAANYIWGYQYETMKDPRLIRNWCQVKYADAVYAVTNAKFQGDKVGTSINDTRKYLRDFPSGGTGYAVAMAILENKPVYWFVQDFGTWVTFNYEDNLWEIIDYPPNLSNNFAGIGTRALTPIGKSAIEQLFISTFCY